MSLGRPVPVRVAGGSVLLPSRVGPERVGPF
jgi:hypothetical protein